MNVFPVKNFMYEMVTTVHGQGPLVNNRRMPCMDMELNAVECLEAYGVNKGMMTCRKFLDDVNECRNLYLRRIRLRIMKEERAKKVITGKIPWEKRWADTYPYDSFVGGTFVP